MVSYLVHSEVTETFTSVIYVHGISCRVCHKGVHIIEGKRVSVYLQGKIRNFRIV